MKTFTGNTPVMNMTLVGFGQAGSRIVDVLAKYQTDDGKKSYNCLALNSNEGDLKELKHIDPKKHINLELGGLGKNPEKAMKILDSDGRVKGIMNDFISNKLRSDDELVVFFAGLGGGTGTSTIVKAIEDFHNHYNKPKIKKVLDAMIAKFSEEKYLANKSQFHKKALEVAEESFVKIGIVACLPVRNDGPDVLRQVSNFANQIWEMANDVTKSVSFVMFPDNQLFYDDYQDLPVLKKSKYGNYRDYANEQIASTFHEVNTAAAQGGTSVTMDNEDFKRILKEHRGNLVISRQELPVNRVHTAEDVVKLFTRTLRTPNLHGPMQLTKKVDGNDIAAKVSHVGLMASLGSDDFGNGGFLETVIENIHGEIPISRNLFPGYIQNSKADVISTYIIYKTDALPERLQKGLVKEYEEYMERNKKFTYESSKIQSIASEDDSDLSDFEDIGLVDLELDDLDLDADVKEDNKSDKGISLEEEIESFDFKF